MDYKGFTTEDLKLIEKIEARKVERQSDLLDAMVMTLIIMCIFTFIITCALLMEGPARGEIRGKCGLQIIVDAFKE